MTHSPYLPPDAHFHTHTHTSTYTRRAEMAKWELALCWRTRRSQVMIHLPEQVTAEHLWLTLMTITAAGMRGSRLSALSSVWRERRERKERQWGNAGASFVSTLHVGLTAFSKSAIENRLASPSLPLLQPPSTPPWLSPSLCFTFSPDWKEARACEQE